MSFNKIALADTVPLDLLVEGISVSVAVTGRSNISELSGVSGCVEVGMRFSSLFIGEVFPLPFFLGGCIPFAPLVENLELSGKGFDGDLKCFSGSFIRCGGKAFPAVKKMLGNSSSYASLSLYLSLYLGRSVVSGGVLEHLVISCSVSSGGVLGLSNAFDGNPLKIKCLYIHLMTWV